MSDDDELPLAVALETGPEEAGNTLPATILAASPVPVTLITGYLGSGKTTLVRHVLQEHHGFRVAVILNEFGQETGLESAFVQDTQGSRVNVPQWVELANGCLCCSVKTEFVQALEGLLAADSGHAGKFDAILVETTGLANPGPIMAQLWTDEELEAAVVLDGLVTVVDGRHIGRQLSETRPGGASCEAQLQVALADIILLNKTDLLSPTEAAAVTARLRSINASAQIIPTSFSKVHLGLILNRGAYHLRLQQQQQDDDQAAEAGIVPLQQQRHLQWLQDVSTAAAAASAAAPAAEGCCSTPDCNNPSHSHHNHPAAAAAAAAACQAHDVAVKTISLKAPKSLQLELFRTWVEGLLWADLLLSAAVTHAATVAAASGTPAAALPEGLAGAAAASRGGSSGKAVVPEVLRMKGLLNVAGSDAVHMFQAVYDLYDIVPGLSWQQFEQQQQGQQQGRLTRLVLIGRRLDQAALQEQLEQCCVDDDDGTAAGSLGASSGDLA